MKTSFSWARQIFHIITYAISHIPAEVTLFSLMGTWLEMGDNICKPIFLPKEGKQSLP